MSVYPQPDLRTQSEHKCNVVEWPTGRLCQRPSTALSLIAFNECEDERNEGMASAQHVDIGTVTRKSRFTDTRTRQVRPCKPSSNKHAVEYKANKLLITKPTNLIIAPPPIPIPTTLPPHSILSSYHCVCCARELERMCEINMQIEIIAPD